MKVFVDSCVVIDLIGLNEPHHDLAVALFAEIRNRRDQACVAQTLKWEMLAVINHPSLGPPTGTLDPSTRQHFQFVPIDERLKPEWFHEVRAPIKGADMIMLACAKYLDAPLITRDGPLQKHAGAFGVRAFRPMDYLSRRVF